MLFRWSVWGDVDSHKEMLRYSVRSFKHYFGTDHEYVVATEQPHRFGDVDGVSILPFDYDDMFCLDSKPTWKKWSPTARIDITQDEVYVDADVFMVGDPIEMNSFFQNDQVAFGIMGEHTPQPWQHGAMRKFATPETPFVNAGLFVQKAGHSIEDELVNQYRIWEKNVSSSEMGHHDEQGCLAIALTEPYRQGKVHVFTQERFKIVGVPEVDSIHTLDGLEVIHAAYPSHPAFYKFKNNLPTI